MKLPSYLSKHLHTSIYLIEWTNVPKSHIDKKHWQTDRITISGIQREGVLHNLSNTQRQKHARGDFTAPTTIQPKGTAIIYICIPCWMVGESWIPLVPISHGISYHMRHYWRKIPAQNYARGQGYRNTLTEYFPKVTSSTFLVIHPLHTTSIQGPLACKWTPFLDASSANLHIIKRVPNAL